MGDSNIEWCDKTWNVTRGCRRISAGCGGANGEGGCYAERMAYRFSGAGQAYDGLVKMTANGPRWTGVGRFAVDKLADPLRWRKPARIFVDSMSDLFYEEFTNEQIAAVFGVMAACPQHTFQVLTKRPKRMREWFAWIAGHYSIDGDPWVTLLRESTCFLTGDSTWDRYTRENIGHHEAYGVPHLWPLPNVHLGVSVEDQTAYDDRVWILLATPAAVRFISAEPLLGDIRLKPFTLGAGTYCHDCGGAGVRIDEDGCCASCGADAYWFGIDQVIAGCESGPGARPCSVEWLRSLRDQCEAADVPFFLKQAPVLRGQVAAPGVQHGDANPVEAGPGSHRKPGGIIGLPYLDGVQHKELPR